MSAFIHAVWTFGHYFGNMVNLAGACVLLSRILLLTLPKPKPGAAGWYPSFITHLWAVSLDVGHLNSQL